MAGTSPGRAGSAFDVPWMDVSSAGWGEYKYLVPQRRFPSLARIAETLSHTYSVTDEVVCYVSLGGEMRKTEGIVYYIPRGKSGYHSILKLPP